MVFGAAGAQGKVVMACGGEELPGVRVWISKIRKLRSRLNSSYQSVSYQAGDLYLMFAAQFDGWQLSHLVHGYTGIENDPAYSTQELGYVEAFGATTLANLSALRQPHGSMVYSTACYNHHISEKASFFSVRTSSGLSESDAVNLFLNGTGTSRERLVDRCQGYECGAGCGVTMLV